MGSGSGLGERSLMDQHDDAAAVVKAASGAGSGVVPAAVTPASAASGRADGSNGDGPAVATGGASARRRERWFAKPVLRAPGQRTARRLAAAADAERERIEQDIHDGLQQHLTALRIRLALAADRFQACGDAEAGAVLEGFGDDVDHAIDELRDLAHGIYPALLTTDGLAAALASAGRHAAVPVTVRADGVRRCTRA